MRKMSSKTGSLLALTIAMSGSVLNGQAPQAPAAPPKPDTPAVTQHVDLARKAAGTEWTQAVDFICKVNPDRANRADDPLIAPTKVFDNVYAIGRTGTTVWAITTSAGIVLIDAGYADQLETVLLPGLKAVGLDPNNVRYILLGHGHGDHFGGAAYFQDKGARVVLSAADWDLDRGACPRACRAAHRRRRALGRRSVTWWPPKGRPSPSATCRSRRWPSPDTRRDRWATSSRSRTAAGRTWRACSAARF